MAASAYHAGVRLCKMGSFLARCCINLFASFETRTRLSPGALLRMRDGGDGIKKEPHPEEPRSGVSKDARLSSKTATELLLQNPWCRRRALPIVAPAGMGGRWRCRFRRSIYCRR